MSTPSPGSERAKSASLENELLELTQERFSVQFERMRSEAQEALKKNLEHIHKWIIGTIIGVVLVIIGGIVGTLMLPAVVAKEKVTDLVMALQKDIIAARDRITEAEKIFLDAQKEVLTMKLELMSSRKEFDIWSKDVAGLLRDASAAKQELQSRVADYDDHLKKIIELQKQQLDRDRQKQQTK